MINIECNPWVGLGTAINVLSLISSLNDNVTIATNAETSIYHQLKSVFNLPNIEISYSQSISNNVIGNSDFTKVVSRYFDTNSIIAKPNNQFKKVIVLAQYNGAAEYDSMSTAVTFPYNRYYPKEIYKKLFDLATAAGFEVVTLNHNYMELEELVHFLQKHCACIIGYDGGLSHLAHVLQIPAVVFPWHHQTNGIEFKNPDGEPNTAHLLHLDRKTYIPNDVNEIYSWDGHYLHLLIDQLNNDCGNNKYLNNYIAKKMNNKLLLYPTDKSKSVVEVYCTDTEFLVIDSHLSHNLIIGGF